MTNQVAVLESIRDVLSGKVAAPAPQSNDDIDEIMDLTKMVNDDGSITDLEAVAETDAKGETEMVKTSTTAGDDVLDEIDKLLAEEDASAEEATLESITDASNELELTEETTAEAAADDMEFDAVAEAEAAPEVEEATTVEEIMTETTENAEPVAADENLISDASADKAKSAIADLLKVTGKDKAEPAPHHPSPSFRNGDTVEDLVLESLKPMLKKWLDENLSSLVEEIVQKEISRIIPK